jgi:hypothetical protein
MPLSFRGKTALQMITKLPDNFIIYIKDNIVIHKMKISTNKIQHKNFSLLRCEDVPLG